jgi:hypothetical protein
VHLPEAIRVDVEPAAADDLDDGLRILLRARAAARRRAAQDPYRPSAAIARSIAGVASG